MGKGSWFYSIDGQSQHGPVTKEGIAALLKSGKIGPDTLLWNPDLANWQTIREVAKSEQQQAAIPPPLPKKDTRQTIQTEPRYKETTNPSNVNDQLEVVEEEIGIEPVALKKAGQSLDELSVKWLWFYTYIRIPLGILSMLASMPESGNLYDPRGIGRSIALSAIAFSLLLFIGLHKRKLWGWRLNWVSLGLEVFLVPLGRTENIATYIIFVAAMICVWFVPNAIYFEKRRHLFT